MKIKKMEKLNMEKKILIAEAVFIVSVLVYLFFSTAPIPIYPLQGMTIVEPDFVFEIENGEQVIVSRDSEFSNPLVLEEGSDINLPEGTYYWKVKGKFRESKVNSFVIKSNVGLDLSEKSESYELENSGNVDLNVSKETSSFSTSFSIDVGESEDLEKDDSKYEGRQK